MFMSLIKTHIIEPVQAQWCVNKPMIITGYLVALNSFILDILSKYAAHEWLRSVPYKSVEIFSFFRITEVWNHGVSFGMLQAGDDTKLWLLRLLTVGILLFLFWYHATVSKKTDSYGLALVIGGACGNIYDRFVHGAVYDFLDVILFGWHFWTFNIADVAISLGAALMILGQFFFPEDNNKNEQGI